MEKGLAAPRPFAEEEGERVPRRLPRAGLGPGGLQGVQEEALPTRRAKTTAEEYEEAPLLVLARCNRPETPPSLYPAAVGWDLDPLTSIPC